MSTIRLHIGILWVLLAGAGGGMAAQDHCSASLDSARMLYRDGLIDNIPALLIPCMDKGFNEVQKAEAYNLLILTYLFDDRQAEAEKQVISLLSEYPTYAPKSTDPVELKYLLSGFRAVPVFSYGLKLSALTALPRITQNHTLSANPAKEDRIGIRPGYEVSLALAFALRHNLFVETGIGNIGRSFTFTSFPLPYTKSDVTEKQNLLSVPLGISFAGKRGGWKPTFGIGGRLDYLWYSKVTPSLEYQTENGGVDKGASINIRSHRTLVQSGVYVNFGMRKITSSGFWYLQLEGRYGFTTQLLDDKRYEMPALWGKYQYIEDNFQVHGACLTAGYMFSAFKPRRIR